VGGRRRAGRGAGRTELARGGIDLVRLDVMLADGDGRDLCREIRATDGPPVIIVSARGAEPQRIEGLEIGADDYLAKPGSAAELLARVRAVLRRWFGTAKVVDMQISSLRRKLGDDPQSPSLLHTVRGVGYLLDA
jgi:DNA-binding response OmpR family regulator